MILPRDYLTLQKEAVCKDFLVSVAGRAWIGRLLDASSTDKTVRNDMKPGLNQDGQNNQHGDRFFGYLHQTQSCLGCLQDC